jgi:uncharacterized glyoxalase superfamily protein PhnB
LSEKDQQTWFSGIGAITLFVEDLEAAVNFYKEVFELPVFFEDRNSTVFKFGSVVINLLKVEEARELLEPATPGMVPAPPRCVYTLDVKDVDAVCERLAAHGVNLLNGPMDRPWGIRTASFADPSGHIWEIAA